MSFRKKRRLPALSAVQQTVSRQWQLNCKELNTFKLEHNLHGSVKSAGLTSLVCLGFRLFNLIKQTLFVLSNFAATVSRLIRLRKCLFKSAGLRQKDKNGATQTICQPSLSCLKIFCQKSKIKFSPCSDMIPGGATKTLGVNVMELDFRPQQDENMVIDYIICPRSFIHSET